MIQCTNLASDLSTLLYVLITGKLSCCEWNPQEDKTLLACTDGKLALFDGHTKLAKVISCSLVCIYL